VNGAKVGHGRSDPLVVHAKTLRLELLKVKADLERELEDFFLNCSRCGLDVHWVSGLGVTAGHWAHEEPAHTRTRWCRAELLNDCEGDGALRAVLVGTTREGDRNP
jgi:hypothetical protein